MAISTSLVEQKDIDLGCDLKVGTHISLGDTFKIEGGDCLKIHGMVEEDGVIKLHSELFTPQGHTSDRPIHSELYIPFGPKSSYPKYLQDGKVEDMYTEQSIESLTASEARTIRELGHVKPHLRQPGVYTFGDVYCGAGGMSRGAKQAGLRVAWGLDVEEFASRAFERNFPDSTTHVMSDESFLEKELDCQVDVLHLSPPFQPFTQCHTSSGPDDDKNRACLTRITLLLIKRRPRIATFGNVPNITRSLKHQVWFDCVKNSFMSLNYSIRWRIIECAKHDVPQKRKRLFLIASQQVHKYKAS